MMRRLVWVTVAAAVVFAAVTLWALESDEVVTLRTRAGDGGITETRVWVADGDGFAWIEAATPERGWYRELQADPSVQLVRGGETLAYDAVGLPGRDGHARIRSMLSAKYGWADVWVGLLQDTSQSIAVRLAPAGATAPAVRAPGEGPSRVKPFGAEPPAVKPAGRTPPGPRLSGMGSR